MTRETIITCDRCKSRGGLAMQEHYFPIHDKKNSEDVMDFCTECYDAFIVFMKAGKEE